jgi:hypothetical protein
MDSEKQGIFLLALKKSKKREGITYCVGVFKLGTPNMEFILGETDNNREYQKGEEISYIYDADYTGSLQTALAWLNSKK